MKDVAPALRRSWARLRALALGVACVASFLGTSLVQAADYPAPHEGVWTIRDFHFASGEVLPELRIHYYTVGDPAGQPVLVLHGTAGSAQGMLNPAFAGELFGPGQPLDAARHFIILPDAIGAGQSSKPSDGLRMAFPHYNYEDMVRAQHALVAEHLGIRQLRLVVGNSMGGMHTWLWGVMYPGEARNLVPLASMPVEVAGRNWMTRRLLVELIKADPEWNGGNYTHQPAHLQLALTTFGVTTLGGNRGWHQVAPTQDAADQYITSALARAPTGDANDVIYQFEASRGYNPSPRLEAIRARVLAVNSADDERNPPELGVMERELRRIPGARLYLIPGSPDTRGHGTTAQARWWSGALREFLAADPL